MHHHRCPMSSTPHWEPIWETCAWEPRSQWFSLLRAPESSPHPLSFSPAGLGGPGNAHSHKFSVTLMREPCPGLLVPGRNVCQNQSTPFLPTRPGDGETPRIPLQ